ncbi:hypothetical protein SK128_017059 [Halocaridina rubra]|uniref:Uncharacterized protein n=1 Tax=Halocaridina rubra TaxID=373956 RepID=A0AAN8WVY2_HALRR
MGAFPGFAAMGVLHDMMDSVRVVGHLRRQHLHALLQNTLQDFASTQVSEIYIALELLSTRCMDVYNATEKLNPLPMPKFGARDGEWKVANIYILALAPSGRWLAA